MFKEFLIKRMMQKQLASLPKDQQEKLIKAVTENPKLFSDIASEMQAAMKAGKDQMAAAQEVLPKYQAQLQAILKP